MAVGILEIKDTKSSVVTVYIKDKYFLVFYKYGFETCTVCNSSSTVLLLLYMLCVHWGHDNCPLEMAANINWVFNSGFFHRVDMMTSSNGNIFHVTGHLCGEFTGLRWIPRTKASDAELWCFVWCARLSKHSRGWSFETLSHPLWRHRNEWITIKSAVERMNGFSCKVAIMI